MNPVLQKNTFYNFDKAFHDKQTSALLASKGHNPTPSTPTTPVAKQYMKGLVEDGASLYSILTNDMLLFDLNDGDHVPYVLIAGLSLV
jgi:hypothetical protein